MVREIFKIFWFLVFTSNFVYLSKPNIGCEDQEPENLEYFSYHKMSFF